LEPGSVKNICTHRIEYIDMSSKNISLREDVYRTLKEAKGQDESFSDVIERLLSTRAGRHPLYDLVGTLDDEEARRVREAAAAFRDSVDASMEPPS
jgi:predicted CopG family antitoxin